MIFLINNRMLLSTKNWNERNGGISIEEFASINGFQVVETPELQGIKRSHFIFENNIYEFDQRAYDLEVNSKVISDIREKREKECFSIINRGDLWYSGLSDSQKDELKEWYREWLNLPNRSDLNLKNPQYPIKPEWIK